MRALYFQFSFILESEVSSLECAVTHSELIRPHFVHGVGIAGRADD